VHKEQAHRQSMAQQQEKAKLASAASKTSATGGNKKSPKR